MWVEYYSIERGGLTVFLHPILGLVFSIIGIVLVIRAFKDPEGRGGCALAFFLLWTTFAMLWTAGVFADIYSTYHSLDAVLTENRYRQVEGQVLDVRTWKNKMGDWEHFSVDSVSFEYHSGGVNPGFNQTRMHRGPIENGRKVRIWYADGVILKLWIWKEQ